MVDKKNNEQGVARKSRNLCFHHSLNEKIRVDMALCIYLFAKAEGVNFSNTTYDYTNLCKDVNTLYSDRPSIGSEDVRSFLRHCYTEKLSMIDFLPKTAETYFRNALDS